MKLLFCFLALGILVFSVKAGDCFLPGQSSEPNIGMPSCCWYEEDSCCVSGGIYQLDQILSTAITTLYNNITDNGVNTSAELEICFAYYENLICSLCAPDPVFLSGGLLTLPTISICESFCVNWFDSCKDLPALAARYSDHEITNGYQLCDFIPTATVLYQENVSNLTNAEPLVGVSILTDGDCFSGVDTEIIIESSCQPWNGDEYYVDNTSDYNGYTSDYNGYTSDYNEYSTNVNVEPLSSDESTNENSSKYYSSEYSSNNSTNGDNGTGDGLGFFWVFIILAIGVAILIVIVISVVGFFLWKRKQAATVTEAGNAYPDMEELDDYD